MKETAHTPDDDADRLTYGQLMGELTQRTLGPWEDAAGAFHAPLTPAGLAAQCQAWAREYSHRPGLARSLAQAAAQYGGWTHGRTTEEGADDGRT